MTIHHRPVAAAPVSCQAPRLVLRLPVRVRTASGTGGAAQVDEKRRRFERDVRPLQDLHLTRPALAAVATLDAVLSRPRGSALLLGRCGASSRGLVELTAYAQRATLRAPACVAGFSLRHFRAFLRECLCSAAVEGTRVVVLVEEHHLVVEDVLACLNSLLAGGEVPGLFPLEELDKALAALKERGGEALPATGGPAALAAAFTHRVQQVCCDLPLVLHCASG